MKRLFALVLAGAMVVGVVSVVASRASAQPSACWYEGMTWDRCNGGTCPGGWCCLICPRPPKN